MLTKEIEKALLSFNYSFFRDKYINWFRNFQDNWGFVIVLIRSENPEEASVLEAVALSYCQRNPG